MKTNFTKRLLGACRQVVLACAMISAIGIYDAAAQTCTVESNTTLDAATCTATLMASDLATGGVGLVFHSVSLDGTPIALEAGNESVIVSAPGEYKYQITDANGCWGTFHVEDKSGPTCSNDGMGGDALTVGTGATAVNDCYFADGSTCADGPLVSTCGTAVHMPNNADNFLNDRFLIRKCTDPAARLENDWAVLEANDFKDCTAVDGDPWFVETKYSSCDIKDLDNAALAQKLGVLTFSVANATAADAPASDLNPDLSDMNDSEDWELCEAYARSWYAKDAEGNVSAQDVKCTQVMLVYRPTSKHIFLEDEAVSECSDVLDNSGAYFLDCDNSTKVYIPDGAERAAAGLSPHYCKYVATVQKGQVLNTCGSNYKQINRWTVVDWCSGAIVLDKTQLTIVQDKTPPTTTASGTIVFAASSFDCNGTITAGAATGTDNCSPDALTWTTSISATGGSGYGGTGDVNTVLNTNGGSLANVPIGSVVTVNWIATDECGNQSAARTETFNQTVDNRAPTAICNDELNVSLVASSGTQEARVYAEDLDDTSRDNCGITKREVSLNGTDYADYVTVDCDDIDKETVVYLKVTDLAGNTNVCWTEITVEDKSIAKVIPLDPITVTCVDDIPAGSVDDVQFISVGCTAPTVELNPDPSAALDCGAASFERTWTITPPANNAHASAAPYTVSQTINITKAPEAWKITFPAQPSTIDCGSGQDIPEPLDISAFISDELGCDNWVRSYSDHEFEGGTTTCRSVVRKYKIVNECNPMGHSGIAIEGNSGEMFTASAGVFTKIVAGAADEVITNYEGIFTFTQKFDIADGTAPVVSFDATPDCNIVEDCNGGEITVDNISVTENCGTAPVSAVILRDANGTLVSSSPTENADGTYTFSGLGSGTYTVRVEARDGCGNVGGLTSSTIEVAGDCKKPTVIGIASFTALMENCTVDIWLSDILASSDDNCMGTWTYGIELANDNTVSATMPTAQEVTITEPGGNQIALWMSDGNGNTQYTFVPVVAQLNPGTNCGGAAAAVAGKITNENDEDIDQVMVKILDSNVSIFEQIISGNYSYSVPMHSNVTITPEKDLGYMNGVTTADLVKLQRHILGISPLSSAYQVIAADVNTDEKVNTKDMLHISRLILGLYDELPNSTSWKFVSKDHQFVNPSSPWGFPQALDYADLESDVKADFIGIKIGDLTGNASPSKLLGTDNTTIGQMTIAMDEATLSPGQSTVVEFKASDFTDFAGYQFTISLGDNVKLAQVTPGVLPNMSVDGNFGLNRLDEGTITTSWSNANGISLEDGAVLFSLTLESTETANLSEVLSINSKQTAAEAYNNDLDVHTVGLQFNRAEADAFQLFQNQPNPFNGETMIGFNMPKTGVATLKVMNIAGQVLTTKSGEFVRGYNQISLSKSELNASGVLYYQIDTENHSATKKMVILE